MFRSLLYHIGLCGLAMAKALIRWVGCVADSNRNRSSAARSGNRGSPRSAAAPSPWDPMTMARLGAWFRFVLWVILIMDGIMLAVFSFVFTHQLLVHAWSWCQRVIFPGSW